MPSCVINVMPNCYVFFRLIPNMYYTVDTVLTDPVIIKAMSYAAASLDFSTEDYAAARNASNFSNTVPPFDNIPAMNSNVYGSLDAALSRVIFRLVQELAQSTNKFSTVSVVAVNCKFYASITVGHSVVKQCQICVKQVFLVGGGSSQSCRIV